MGLKSRLLCAAAILGAALPAAAHAQVNDEEITDVIRVTTQFREQSLADVPINVSAFDEELLDDLSIADFEDLAAFTPGLVVQEQSPNNTGYSIRGITSDSGEATAETRVAVFQDGVSITRSRGSYVELFDIERVEIAKGPQPTLFGRGALIGGINIIQNKAEDEFSASIQLGAGNEGQFEANGHVNYALSEDYAVRFAAVARQRDGHIDNVLGGRALQGRDTWAVRGVFSGAPSDRFNFDLIVNHQEDTPPGTSFKSGTFPAPGGDTNPFTPAALQTFGGFQGGQELGLERTVTGLTALAEYQINDAWTLNSITGYREFDSAEVFDPDGSFLPLIVIAENATGEQFSQEFRFNYDAGGRLTGSIGALYFDEEGEQDIPLMMSEAHVQALLAPTLAAGAGLDVATVEFLLGQAGIPGASNFDNIFDPLQFSALGALLFGQAIPLSPVYEEVAVNAGEQTSIDLFADASFAVTDRFTLTGGLRWTSEDKTSFGSGDNVNGPNNVTFSPTLIIPATANGETVSQSGEFDDFTWRLAGSYAATDNLNVWASLARGRRPDVISVDTSSATSFSIAPAEIVDSVEAGAFVTLENGTLSGSIYRSEYENFQANRFDPNTVSFVVTNAGAATQYGLELNGDFELTDRVDAYVSYAFNSAKFDETDGDGNALELANNTFRYAPKHSASLGVRADLFEGDWGRVSFIPTWSWQSQIFFDNDNDRFGGILNQGAYSLINARLRYETLDGRFHVEAYGDNVMDQDYLIDAGNTGGSFGIPTFIAGAPALWGVRIGAEF